VINIVLTIFTRWN